MSKSIEPNYNGKEYVELQDNVSGAVFTLEQAVDEYINTLSTYITSDNFNHQSLDRSIERTVDSIERVYDSLEDLDELLEEETMMARIQRDGERGFCDLGKNLERISEGLYSEINSFEDLLTLFQYVDQDSFEADQKHLKSVDENVEAPTKILYEKERIQDLKEDLNTQYRRLVYSEIIARRFTKSEITFEPEPPIFRKLGDTEHPHRLNKLNKEVRKNS